MEHACNESVQSSRSYALYMVIYTPIVDDCGGGGRVRVQLAAMTGLMSGCSVHTK